MCHFCKEFGHFERNCPKKRSKGGDAFFHKGKSTDSGKGYGGKIFQGSSKSAEPAQRVLASPPKACVSEVARAEPVFGVLGGPYKEHSVSQAFVNFHENPRMLPESSEAWPEHQSCFLTQLPEGMIIVDTAASKSLTRDAMLKRLLRELQRAGLPEATWKDDGTEFRIGADASSMSLAIAQVPVGLGGPRCFLTFHVIRSDRTPPF